MTAVTETFAVPLPAARLSKPVAPNLPAAPVATTFRASWKPASVTAALVKVTVFAVTVAPVRRLPKASGADE